jgi:uncharacterized protein DUF5399
MPAVTIDQFDLSVYNLYAIRTKMIEQTVSQFQLEKASTIPPQTMLVDLYPKMTEIDILLGVSTYFTPWAYFYPPINYRNQRRSPFAFHRVAPTLGSSNQDEFEEKMASIECQSEDEESEKQAIVGCMKEVDKLNGWVGFIIGRIGQFLQG